MVASLLIDFVAVLASVGIIGLIRWLSTLAQQRNLPPHVTTSLYFLFLFVVVLLLWFGLLVVVTQVLYSAQVSQVVGGTLIGSAIGVLSVIVRLDETPKQTPDSAFSRYFGDEWVQRLIKGEFRESANASLNAKVFERFATVLKVFGHTETEEIEQTVSIRRGASDQFLVYDSYALLKYVAHAATRDAVQTIPIKIEIHPYQSIRGPRQPRRPNWTGALSYEGPQDKWPGKFLVPLIDDGDPAHWRATLEEWNILVRAIHVESITVWDHDGVSPVRGQNEKPFFPKKEYTPEDQVSAIVDRETSESIEALNVSFSVNLPLQSSHHYNINYSVENIPHPVNYFWMAWYASDVITSQWKVSVRSELPIIRDVLCITANEDVKCTMSPGKSDTSIEVALTPEPKNKGAIMPFDSIMVSLDPTAVTAPTAPTALPVSGAP